MKQAVKKRSRPGQADARSRVSVRTSTNQSGGRWRWALPVLVALIGGVVMTSELVLGGASAHDHPSGSATKNPSPSATSPAASPTPQAPSEPVPVGTFATRVYKDASGASMTYYLYGPNSYTPAGKYPLVLVLHGGGERFDPTLSAAQNRNVVLRQVYVTAFTQAQVQARWPCFVVVPQAPLSQRWVGGSASVASYTLAPSPTQALTQAMGIVQNLQQAYASIDANRIYVGGISMGAFGTWEALERWPQTFAAAFPIAGAGDPQAAGHVQAAVWAFHGSGDGLVPVAGSRLMVQAVQGVGGMVCYTEYPGAAHDIWLSQRPLSDLRFLQWLFSQHRTGNSSVAGLDCQGYDQPRIS